MVQIKLRYLQGRNFNGAHRDAGTKIHAVADTALCGAKPGRLSGGWDEPWQENPEISCERCIKKFNKINEQTPLHNCLGCSSFISCNKWCESCCKRGMRSIELAIISTYRFLNPLPAPILSKTPPDSPFLRQLWEAASSLED